MPQGDTISFVIFPDGKLDEQSLTVSGRQIAIQRCIGAWLPERYFGRAPSGYVADSLWKEMREKGFKVYTIKIGPDGSPIVGDT